MRVSPINIAPRQWLSLSFLVLAACAIANISGGMQEPTLGITWQASEQGLSVAEVAPGGPAEQAGIRSGMTVLSISSAELHQPLSPTTLTEEPSSLVSYDVYNRFFKEQTTLFNIISSDKVQLEVAGNGMITVKPEPRSIAQLSILFWFQLACSFVVWATSMAVVIFRPENTAARIYGVMGFSFAMITFCTAIYSGRELATSGELFYLLAIGSHFSGLMLTFSFVALLWHIPQQINQFPIFRVFVVLYSGFWLADVMQLGNGSPADWFHIPVIISLLSGFSITIVQWFKSRQQPEHRLTLKWIMFSMLVPGMLFVGGNTVFQLQQLPALIPQGYAFGLLVLIYVCISLGISRFALFDLDDWWQQIWLWLLISTLFIITDIIFVSFMKWHDVLSAITSLSIIGFLYLPLRQWMFTHVFSRNQVGIEQIFSDIVQLAVLTDDKKALREAWEALLRKVFSPLEILQVENSPKEAEMLRFNVALMVPDIGTGSPLLLAYADQGGRLFSQKDRTFIATLSSMTRKAIEDAHAYQKGIDDERQRITSDLHDDLGAKLLSLVYKSENSEQRKLARQAINDLRDIIDYNQDSRSNQHDWAAQWKRECLRRVNESDIQLQWQQWHLSDHYLPAHMAQQLSRVLREALSNALRHGDGTKISVRIHMRGNKLFMSVRNHCPDLQRNCSGGHGMKHMKARIQTLHGTIRWRAGKKGGCHVIWAVPIDDCIDS